MMSPPISFSLEACYVPHKAAEQPGQAPFLSSRTPASLLQHWPLCCNWGKFPPDHLLSGIRQLLYLLLLDTLYLGIKVSLLYFLHLVITSNDAFPPLLDHHHFLILDPLPLLPDDFRRVNIPLSPPPLIIQTKE